MLQERRGPVFDAPGQTELAEGTGFFPAVVAVGDLALGVVVLGVALADKVVVGRGGALAQRLDDLDGVGIVGEVGVVGRLHPRAGADLEHLLAALDVDHVGHACLQMRTGHGHAPTDVEEGVLVGTLVDRRIDRSEFLARRHQESADGRCPPDVLVLVQCLETVPALAEEHRILAAGLAPGDEIVALLGRRRSGCLRTCRPRRPGAPAPGPAWSGPRPPAAPPTSWPACWRPSSSRAGASPAWSTTSRGPAGSSARPKWRRPRPTDRPC